MRTARITLAALLAVLVSIGCSATPSTEKKRQTLRVESDAALARMRIADPSLRDEIEKAYGYAIFPSVGKGGLIVGGAYGRGVVYEQGEFVGFCDLTQGTVGAQIGGQAYMELLLFEYKEAMDHFKSGNFALAAQVSAVAITAGASENAKYDRGVKVLTMAKGGAMLEASVGGQQFEYNWAPSDSDE